MIQQAGPPLFQTDGLNRLLLQLRQLPEDGGTARDFHCRHCGWLLGMANSKALVTPGEYKTVERWKQGEKQGDHIQLKGGCCVFQRSVRITCPNCRKTTPFCVTD